MPRFYYQALTAAQDLVAGKVEADGVQQAIAQLESTGLVVQAIGYAPIDSSGGLPGATAADPTVAAAPPVAPSAEGGDQEFLRTHMAQMFKRGKALVPALRAYGEEMPWGRERRQLRAACRMLEQGESVEASRAIGRLPQYWIPLLSSAATARDPALLLTEFLDESRRAGELRRQWWLTLVYPVIVASLAVAVLMALSYTVIPTFRDVFDDFGLQLPAFTRITLEGAALLISGRMLLSLAIVAAIILACVYGPRLFPGRVSNWISERFSWFGRSNAVAQLSRFTAELLEAGFDLPVALRVTSLANPKPRIQRTGLRLAADLEEGRRAAPFSSRRSLTGTLLYALETEMPTATRVRLLKELSDCYADRARSRLSLTHGVVGPLAIVVVGFLVGFVVLSLFLPLVDLINNLSG